MAAKLLFTLMCDDARIEMTNKLIIIGLYNKIINFAGLGARQGFAGLAAPRRAQEADAQVSPPKYALPMLCLVRRWILDSPLKVQTSIIGPDGKSAVSVETSLSPPEDESYCQDVVQIRGIVLIPGLYKIIATFNDGAPRTIEENFFVKG